MRNILITGGAGFIGSHLANRLAEIGHNVTVIDNLNPQIHGADPLSSALFLTIRDRVSFVRGDIRNKEVIGELIRQNEIIIHLAAETGTGQSMYSVADYVSVNSLGTAIILDVLVNGSHNVEKLIFASSRAVYGEGKYFCTEHGTVYPGSRVFSDMSNGNFDCLCPVCSNPVKAIPTDENTPCSPKSVYGITKLNQEQLITLVCNSMKINSVALRFQNVYGPCQSLHNPYTGILAVFSNLLREGKQIDVYEDGKESRDFVYVDDVIQSVVNGIEYNGSLNNFAVNIGSGKRLSVLEIAEILKKEFSSGSEIIISGKYRTGDIRHNVANISLAKEMLDYAPVTDFGEGIKMFCNWVKKQQLSGNMYDQSISELKRRGLLKG